jgi:hypothetical protein
MIESGFINVVFNVIMEYFSSQDYVGIQPSPNFQAYISLHVPYKFLHIFEAAVDEAYKAPNKSSIVFMEVVSRD